MCDSIQAYTHNLVPGFLLLCAENQYFTENNLQHAIKNTQLFKAVNIANAGKYIIIKAMPSQNIISEYQLMKSQPHNEFCIQFDYVIVFGYMYIVIEDAACISPIEQHFPEIINEQQILRIIWHLCKCIEYFHANCVPVAISFSCILFNQSSQTIMLTNVASFLSTHDSSYYTISPEQNPEWEKSVSYSLGVILYKLLTLCYPFEGSASLVAHQKLSKYMLEVKSSASLWSCFTMQLLEHSLQLNPNNRIAFSDMYKLLSQKEYCLLPDSSSMITLDFPTRKYYSTYVKDQHIEDIAAKCIIPAEESISTHYNRYCKQINHAKWAN